MIPKLVLVASFCHVATGALEAESDHASLVQSAASTRPALQARPRKLHLLSHRSCSQDLTSDCSRENAKAIETLRRIAGNYTQIDAAHLYDRLPDELMNDPRWKRHVPSQVRGRGYWFWKAALSNMLLYKGEMQLGDDLLYVDADALGELDHLLKMREETTEDVVIRKQPHCEHVWTKGEIFERFNTTWDNPHYGLTQQPKAQAFLMRLNARTSRLLRTWEMLLQDFHLVSDEASRNTALDGPWHKRKENRHDQSLLSMVIKASVPKSGACKEPDFACDNLGQRDETAGWSVHPELGVPGLTVRYT
eukprot:s680_g4.t1